MAQTAAHRTLRVPSSSFCCGARLRRPEAFQCRHIVQSSIHLRACVAQECTCGVSLNSSSPSLSQAGAQPCPAGRNWMSMLLTCSTRVGWSARRPPATGQPSRVPTTCSGPGELLGRPQRRVPPPAAAGEFGGASGSRGPEQPGSSSGSGGGSSGLPPAAARSPAVRGVAPEDPQAAEREVLKLVNLLPPSVKQRLEQHPELPMLLEVVMDLGR